jgi:hypothetical protein
MCNRCRWVSPLLLAAALDWGAPAGLGAQNFGPALTRSAWIGIVALLLGIAAAVVAVVLFRRQSDRRAHDIPLLVFPAAPAAQPRRTRTAPEAQRPVAPQAQPAVAASHAAPAPHRVHPSQAAQPRAAPSLTAPSRTAAAGMAPAPAVEVRPAAAPPVREHGGLVDGTTIRFYNPIEGTLQILPGRLEVVAGADSGHSIRFVRAGGEPEVTFGRSEGPPYRHIQLRAPTVSRQHARMRFGGDGWNIANLSQTNPVVVNGRELVQREEEIPLRDGDRIEMGEVAFLYRER